MIRARLKRRAGRRLAGTGKLRKAILAALPFKLTGAQTRALAEIDADLASPHRMLRLLQGDVGSGKTVVALLAMASGGRGRRAGGTDGADRAARAPASSRPSAAFGAAAGLRIALLTGRERGRERAEIVAALKAGASTF